MEEEIKYKQIRVSESVHERLKEDSKHFQKSIGIKFSFNSTINEYHKILDGLKENE